jgi:acetate kinase
MEACRLPRGGSLQHHRAQPGWDHAKGRKKSQIYWRERAAFSSCPVSHDIRSIVEAIELGNDQARLALDLFCYPLARAILGLAAGLERIDALIFTGGIGENSAVVRSITLEHLAILHPEIDQGWNERNGQHSNGRIIKEAGLACFVIQPMKSS